MARQMPSVVLVTMAQAPSDGTEFGEGDVVDAGFRSD